ncbi:ABC transporter substrate-binding protein [Streptomyces aureus]|uniref:ABC transporter substrate-binding protein n=1 Tax=Streptomyces aureus TaxID=193461 RepID=UPI0033FD1AD5
MSSDSEGPHTNGPRTNAPQTDGSRTNGPRTRVTWWLGRGPGPQDLQDLFVDPFNAGQEHVRLDLEVLTSRARDRTVEALEAGTAPDIVMVPRAGDFVSLAARGLLLDLTPCAERHGWGSRLLGPALRLATLDGRLFGVPRSGETMMLLFNSPVLDDLGHAAPSSSQELEKLAEDALRRGITPFGAGCADMPESCELLWTLVLNHYAGPAAVRAALLGEIPWTAEVFVEAMDRLRGWFDRGWFGDRYFEDTIDQGLDRVVSGGAAMAPAMTGLLPRDHSRLGAVPFPVLRDEVAAPLFVFGTASLIGVSARSRQPEAAARVLDALFDGDVRRRFSARVPGDWNIPLADTDADALRSLAPGVFANPAIGLTESVAGGRHGYASWSFLPPRSEALVVAQVRPLVEGALTAREHLAELQEVFAEEAASGPLPGVLRAP